MLWNNSQESWKEFLIRCYKASAGQLNLTLEAAADEVVKIHNSNGGQNKTGQHFNPASVTEANRLKANCAALQRFMEKEDALEMLPYMLGGMSTEAKLAFANQYLAPAGIRCALAEKEQEDGFGIEAALDAQISVNRASEKIAEAAINPTPQNLELAEREIHKASEKFKRVKALINGAKKAASVTKAAIGRVCHPNKSAAVQQ